MKKLCLATTIAVFYLAFSNGLQAQTTQTKLNQIELMKQFVDTWQYDISKDTIDIWECKRYGNAFVSTANQIINGKESFLFSENWIFSHINKYMM